MLSVRLISKALLASAPFKGSVVHCAKKFYYRRGDPLHEVVFDHSRNPSVYPKFPSELKIHGVECDGEKKLIQFSHREEVSTRSQNVNIVDFEDEKEGL